MKKLFCISFFLLSGVSFQTFAQEDCPPPTAFEQLDINNVRANYYNNGVDWNNTTFGHSGYVVPVDQFTHSIFSGEMWIGGINSENELKMTNDQLGFLNNETHLRSGPMNYSTPGVFITADCVMYDQIYKISRSEVMLHLLYFEMMFENDGVPPSDSPFENGYEIPGDILNWPAHAEVIPGQPQELAPFFDNDCCGGTPGVYEPELGDYPAFRFPDNEDEFDCEKHLLGDQVLWWVNHNSTPTAVDTAGNGIEPTGFEFHHMAYAYIADNEINNYSFLRRTIINRSGWDYSNVHCGQFIDGDFSGSVSDLFGTHVERGLVYFYYGSVPFQFEPGDPDYTQYPPAIGFNWVGGPLAENDGLDNNYNEIIDEPGERLRLEYSQVYSPTDITEPEANSIFQLFMGNQPNGDPFYITWPEITDTVPYKMIFPGDSDPLNLNTYGIPVEPWNMSASGNPAAGNGKFVMSSGPFALNADETKVFTIAIPWSRDENCSDYTCFIESLFDGNDLAQELHDNCYEMPCMVLDAQFEVEIEDGQAFFSSPITSGIEYHWTFGDGEEMTTTTPFASHNYKSTDEITVCLEIDYGCGTSSHCDSLDNLVSSVSEISATPQIISYPNPANDRLHLQLSDFEQQPHDVQIFALSGQLVKNERLGSITENTIDISALPNGVYILKVGSDDGQNILHKRFVVVR